MRSVYLETYGCQMNEADSGIVRSVLAENGYGIHPTAEGADVILVNTCAVREHAEERIFGRVGELAQHKHARPEVLIGVLGCMAQHLKDKLLQRSRFVDLVAGPDSYRRLPDLIEEAASERIVDVRLDREETYEGIIPTRTDGIAAWLTVQRGCDKHCTFCIVPAVRGRERCVPLEEAVQEAERLCGEGVKEITLLGQTVNSYHDGTHDFADLLGCLARIDGLARIRFTSPYPTEFSDRTIDVIAGERKIARHVHLPLQSASNRVLHLARRRYTVEQFDETLSKLRKAIPGLAVSTDIIVGFHGEGEAEFAETCEYLKRVRFDFAFMFKYSKRSQTTAYRWPEEVDEVTKSQRLKTIIEIQEQISRELQQESIGQTVQVLIEGHSRKADGRKFGRTSEFRQVVFDGDGVSLGSMVDIRITAATGHTLLGEMARVQS